MIQKDKDRAIQWYKEHRKHVNMLLSVNGPSMEPTREDARNPALWKAIHWRWFIAGEVYDQIFKQDKSNGSD